MKIRGIGVLVVLSGSMAAQQLPQQPDPLGSSAGGGEASAVAGEGLDTHTKKGSEADVSAVGKRKMGGRGLHNWYSGRWERDTGLQYSMEIEKTSHLVADAVVVEYVNRVGQRLVRNSDAKAPFTIRVLDSDEVNAMALPGGYLYVNSGLILVCESEDELAGVLAHEIAHVAAHHAAREMTKLEYVQLSSIPMVMLAQGSWTGYGVYEVSQMAMPVPLLEFSRKYETEADYLGVQYMYKAGYDPQAMVSVFQRLEAMRTRKPGAIARTFSQHPATPERVAAVEREIAAILPPVARQPSDGVSRAEFESVKERLEQTVRKRRASRAGAAVAAKSD